MFTGIIQSLGFIAASEDQGSDQRLTINTGKLNLGSVAIGDSIAVNGVCLTAVEKNTDSFVADVSGETLQHTTIGQLKAKDRVNLELALTLSTPLGGHLVSGHVDGVGEVIKRWQDGRSERFNIAAPENLAKYIAAKGSICVDGVSLTVNRIENNCFELNLVPHTLQETTLDGYGPGRKVNLEVDIIARYLERLVSVNVPAESNIDEKFLQDHGFIR